MTGKSGDTAHVLGPQDDEVRKSPESLTDRSAAGTGVPGAHMSDGARTPEELETLLEDALVVRDREALAALFGEESMLVPADDRPARGSEQIARMALALWDSDHSYVADPRRVVQMRDIALVIGEQGINVARRSHDGAWRYAIVVQMAGDGIGRSER